MPASDPAPTNLAAGEEAGASFPLLAFGELAAGKLGAFLDRVAPRYLWDVARLPTFTSTWPDPLDRATCVALAGALPHPLHTYDRSRLDRIGNADQHQVRQVWDAADLKPHRLKTFKISNDP